MSSLRAVTRPLAAGTDLLAELGPGDFVFKRNGVGLVGSGVAARVPLDGVAAALAAIETVDTVQRRGTGAIAVGPFPSTESMPRCGFPVASSVSTLPVHGSPRSPARPRRLPSGSTHRASTV